ncbi:MAG TPA: ABC transporter permease subunit [Streptosporangiaceae bacterium]|jgi:peptide/nickel transport system permease protein
MSVTDLQVRVPGEQAAPARVIEGRSQARLTWQRLRRDKMAVASAIIIVIMAALALAAPAFAALLGHGVAQQFPNTGISATGAPAGPSGTFWLGADELGRDLFVRILYGARISLAVGVITTVLGTVAGVAVGLAAGYFGGWIDMTLSRFIDAVLAFPFIVLGLALAAVLGPSLPVVIGVITFFTWAGIARVVRGQTISIREKEYIEAARSLGAGSGRIMFTDIMPNLLGPVLVLATLSVPSAIIFEATLSFLGLGVQPPTASWGNILAGAQNYYSVAWWYLLFPALALLITTLAFNLLGDGIRDALDPSTERLFAGTGGRKRRRKRARPAGTVLSPPPAPSTVPAPARDQESEDSERLPLATPTGRPAHAAGPVAPPARAASSATAPPPARAGTPPAGSSAASTVGPQPAPANPPPAPPPAGSGAPASAPSRPDGLWRRVVSGPAPALAGFLVRRIVAGIVVLWVVSLATFLLFFTRPPLSVARSMAGKEPTAAQLNQIVRQLGLDQPIPQQYWHFLVRLLHGNFGYSYANSEPVSTIMAQDLPRTASVVVGGVVLWLVAGIAVGVLSATRARSLFDRLATVGVLAGLSLPTFVLGQLLLWGVFLQLNKRGFTWIQDGYVGPTQSLSGWFGCMILPWITVATVSAAVYSRLTRGSLLDTLSEDYIRTARAKGLSERRVVFRHGMRSALTPVVSQLGIDVGTLLGGVVITETVFGIGGIGQDSVQAIVQGNLPVIIGFVLLATLFVVVANIVVDFCYTLLDPRVRIS